jgi:nucleotide-binding universal stress UspA family protein
MQPRVVVGLGGATGWYALAWAAEHASASGADLILCHACPADSPLATRRVPPPSLIELCDPPLARAVAATKARLGGHRVTLRVEPVRPADLILAAEASADLVVVGPPGQAPAGHRETAHRVAAHAKAPVVVARRGGGRTHGPFAGHVVVGVDGSPAARAALELGFEEAALHRRPLAAVHVTTTLHDDFWFDDTMLSSHFVVEPAGLDLLADEVEPWSHKYPNVPVKRAMFAGRPVEGLLRAANGAALLCVGDRGRSWPARTVLGSVSDRAIDGADAPVAVVKGGRR